MPLDHFQIAQEHHRGGRLTAAEENYRLALAHDAEHADAMHWLGVLLLQAGQVEQAIELLRSAAQRRLGDAAFQHNLAEALLAGGRLDDAIEAFARAVAADESRKAPRVALAQAYLIRRKPGDAVASVAILERSLQLEPDSADVISLLGVALMNAGRFIEAMNRLQTALAKKPNDAVILLNLGLSAQGAGLVKDARKALNKALEIDPAISDAWCALGLMEVDAGNDAVAVGLFRRAIAADRDDIGAYVELAQSLQRLGKTYEAEAAAQQIERLSAKSEPDAAKPPPTSVAEFEKQLAPTSDQAQAHFAMAALLNVFPPAHTPGESVAKLFDSYADKFDEHLVGRLDYRVPEELVEAMTPFWPPEKIDILDAGCGTGLIAPHLRHHAKSLVGVDISGGMVDKARERGLYDNLIVEDLLAFLGRSSSAFDLIVCADVLIYVGDSTPFFDAARKALRPCGILAYSVEACPGDRYELVPRSRRFRHSKPYLQRLATMFDFEELHFAAKEVRKELGQPVEGYLVILRKPSIS